MPFDKALFEEMLASEEGKALAEGTVAQGLKNKNTELMNKLAARTTELGSFKELGDVEALRSVVDEVVEAKEQARLQQQQALKASGDIEAIQANFDEQIAAQKNAYSDLKGQLVNDAINTQLKSALTKNGGVPELLMPAIRNRVTGEYENGRVNMTVLGADGQNQYVDGNPATVNDLVAELKTNEAYQVAFKPTGGQGSGTSTQHGVASTSRGSVDVDSPDFSWEAVEAQLGSNPGSYAPKYAQKNQSYPTSGDEL